MSVAVQQGQQWCMTWLEQLHQFILQLCEEQHAQHAKDIVLRTAASVQRGWQEVQYQYYNAQWNTLGFYHQLGTLCANKGIYVYTLKIYKCNKFFPLIFINIFFNIYC